jgi:tetratricopeptide (TPR) repeat protein
MYRIHPALPGYLAAGWRREDPGNHDAVRDAATKTLLSAHGALGGWLYQQIRSGDAGLAYTVIGLERRTLGGLLGYALDHGLWDDAQHIAQPLDEYWQARGLYDEAGAWADRARLATEDPDGTPPQLDTAAGALWLFFTSSQAIRDLEGHRLDDAERTYQQILTALQAQPSSPKRQQHLGVIYHQLGIAAGKRGRLDDAEDWYRKSLAIEEELGNRPGMADSYHVLGSVALLRARLNDAEDWYRKSLVIKQELGNRPHTAMTYHQLGMVAQFRGRLDDAKDLYRKAVAIEEEFGDRPGMALTYGQLGLLAEDRGQPRQALEWMVRSVALFTGFPHPATGAVPDHLTRLTVQFGVGALEQCWRQVAGSPLPPAIRSYVDSSRANE